MIEATHYQLLGVPPDASPDDIKVAYRRAARRYHPDANPDHPAAAERFKEVVVAYETLANAERRADYDAALLAASAAGREHSFVVDDGFVDAGFDAGTADAGTGTGAAGFDAGTADTDAGAGAGAAGFDVDGGFPGNGWGDGGFPGNGFDDRDGFGPGPAPGGDGWGDGDPWATAGDGWDAGDPADRRGTNGWGDAPDPVGRFGTDGWGDPPDARFDTGRHGWGDDDWPGDPTAGPGARRWDDRSATARRRDGSPWDDDGDGDDEGPTRRPRERPLDHRRNGAHPDPDAGWGTAADMDLDPVDPDWGGPPDVIAHVTDADGLLYAVDSQGIIHPVGPAMPPPMAHGPPIGWGRGPLGLSGRVLQLLLVLAVMWVVDGIVGASISGFTEAAGDWWGADHDRREVAADPEATDAERRQADDAAESAGGDLRSQTIRLVAVPVSGALAWPAAHYFLLRRRQYLYYR